jgi:hypothetical protein
MDAGPRDYRARSARAADQGDCRKRHQAILRKMQIAFTVSRGMFPKADTKSLAPLQRLSLRRTAPTISGEQRPVVQSMASYSVRLRHRFHDARLPPVLGLSETTAW